MKIDILVCDNSKITFIDETGKRIKIRMEELKEEDEKILLAFFNSK